MNWEVRTMKSGTSCFNWTLFKRNLTRFWPIWVSYALIWIYALPVNCFMVVSRNMAWMVKCFAAGKAAGIERPALEPIVRTNFIR